MGPRFEEVMATIVVLGILGLAYLVVSDACLKKAVSFTCT